MSPAIEGLRKRRTSHFVQVDRATVRNKDLSYRELGLLTYLLDMPDGWDVKSEVLAEGEGREGREAVRTALRALAKHGYYRLERRRLLDGRNVMGTAISELPVESWIADSAEYDNKAVPVVQQPDGSFQVKHLDGTLTDDGFEDAVDPDEAPEQLTQDDTDAQGVRPPDSTGDGFSGAGFPGPGFPDAGSPDSGFPGALREKEKGDREGELLHVEAGASPRDEAADADALPVEGLPQPDPMLLAVERVCKHLADRIEGNGSKRPTVTKRWRDAARLLMTLDGVTEDRVHRAIDWCQDDEFWRANVLSMPTLREKYDQLRLQAQRQQGGRPRPQAYNDEATWGSREERAAAAQANAQRSEEEIDAEIEDLFRDTRPRSSAHGG